MFNQVQYITGEIKRPITENPVPVHYIIYLECGKPEFKILGCLMQTKTWTSASHILSKCHYHQDISYPQGVGVEGCQKLWKAKNSSQWEMTTFLKCLKYLEYQKNISQKDFMPSTRWAAGAMSNMLANWTTDKWEANSHLIFCVIKNLSIASTWSFSYCWASSAEKGLDYCVWQYYNLVEFWFRISGIKLAGESCWICPGRSSRTIMESVIAFLDSFAICFVESQLAAHQSFRGKT